MKQRITAGESENKALVRAAPEDIEAHLHALRQLAAISNQAMNATIAFQLRMQCAVNALEFAYQQVACTDLRRPKQLLSLREAALKLGVSTEQLRKDGGHQYPKAHRGKGGNALFRGADIDLWLERQ